MEKTRRTNPGGFFLSGQGSREEVCLSQTRSGCHGRFAGVVNALRNSTGQPALFLIRTRPLCVVTSSVLSPAPIVPVRWRPVTSVS